jgi:hypothetical protein
MTFEEKLRAAIKQDWEYEREITALEKDVELAHHHLEQCIENLKAYRAKEKPWRINKKDKVIQTFTDSVIRELEA